MLYWCFHANLFLFIPMYLYHPNVNEFSAYSPLPPPNPPQNSASCQCFWLRPLRRLRSPSHTVPISFALSVSCENRPQQPGKICCCCWLAGCSISTAVVVGRKVSQNQTNFGRIFRGVFSVFKCEMFFGCFSVSRIGCERWEVKYVVLVGFSSVVVGKVAQGFDSEESCLLSSSWMKIETFPPSLMFRTTAVRLQQQC